MIDLTRFTQEQEAIVPVLDKKFQYNRKKYTVSSCDENGWYKVAVSGNSAKIIEPAYMEVVNHSYKIIKGYTYNNNVVFQNFDVGKRLSGMEVMAQLHLNNSPTFCSIEAILWEDRNIYYYRPNYVDVSIYSINTAVDISEIKGLTPELKTLFLFHSIEREQLRIEQERLKKSQEIEEFKKTLQGRLMLAFSRAGATILNYSITGNRITVEWQLSSTGTEFNSVVEADTFRVIEAGYCMSGHDRSHSVHSLVQLADSYEEDGLIHITRD